MAILDQVPVDKITAQAREIHFWRTVLSVIAGILFGIGWIVAKAFGLAWFALSWCSAAVKVGWTEGRKRGPSQ